MKPQFNLSTDNEMPNPEPMSKSIPKKLSPSIQGLWSWLAGSYLIALSILALVYTVLAIWNGIFHIDLLFMMIIGFPMGLIALFQLDHIGRDLSIIVGYAVYLLIAMGCTVFKNIGIIWKIFLWIFLILLLLNLVYCVPKAAIFGIEEIH